MSANNGRAPDGRFAAGNAGGPGRPRREVETAYLTALTESVAVGDWQRIAARAVKDALKGDARARDWLSRYLLPDPGSLSDERQDIDGVLAEIRRHKHEWQNSH